MAGLLLFASIGLFAAPAQAVPSASFAKASPPTTATYIDPALPDAQQLQAAVSAQQSTAPLLQNGKQAGTQPGVFHLFSHGKPGQLFINGQWLSAPQIAAWLRQNGLPEGVEHLNLYGCEFAQGEAGQQAVTALEQALGLTVAASTNITGQGGDWVLEVGQPVAALRVEDYAHSLQCTGAAGNCDGDAVLDLDDRDDDNDGILDFVEWGTGVAITPANLGLGAGQINRTVTNIDVSTLLSLPAGSIRISGTGIHTGTGVNAGNFWSGQGRNNTVITVTSTLGYAPRLHFVGDANIEANTTEQMISLDGSTYTRIVTYAYPAGVNYINYGVTNTTATNYNLPGESYQFLSDRTISNFSFSNNGANPQIANFQLILLPPKDTDKDGILDHRDIDSDNDGCADAIEGGASFTAADIDANWRLTGSVQANGVPTVAGAGQTVGDSTVATQVVVNTAPANQTVTTVPSAASFSIATTATNTSSFTAGTPNYGSGSSANANTSYRWYLGDPDAGGTALTNTGVYSGTTSATLGISDVNNLIGNTYYVVVTQSNHACTRIVRNAQLLSTVVDLGVTKTNNLPGTTDQASDSVTRGQNTSYRIIVTNNGPQAVTGAVVTDTPTGLTCTGLTCNSSSGSSCPAAPTAAQLTGSGVTLQALPVSGTVTMDLACTVN